MLKYFVIFLLLYSNSNFASEVDLIKHLLHRTSFSTVPTFIEQHSNYNKAVNQLLNSTKTEAQTRPPINILNESHIRYKDLNLKERMALNKTRRNQANQLKAWWIKEMITTPSPLTEEMTLFWHNHFTSSIRKVKSVSLMYKQNVLLRRHALGNFRDLLQQIAKDPAMVIYLDSAKNKKSQANENFAREVMELFTLGEGHYSEDDIKQAAIAFTGWSVNRKTGEFQFRKKQHNNQAINVLGKTIPSNGIKAGEEVLEQLLDHPQTAIYLSTKLYKHFISHDNIDQKTIDTLANTLRSNNYEIKPWLKVLFLSDSFKQQALKGTLIKSPIDLIVGTFRSLNLPIDNDAKRLAKVSRRLGQDLFAPPNVKGWPGGKQWITTDSFLARKQILGKILREKNMMGTMMNSMKPTQNINLLSVPNNKFLTISQQVLNPAYQVK